MTALLEAAQKSMTGYVGPVALTTASLSAHLVLWAVVAPTAADLLQYAPMVAPVNSFCDDTSQGCHPPFPASSTAKRQSGAGHDS